MTDANADKWPQTAKALYIVFVACAIALFLPFLIAMAVSTLAMIVALAIAYRSRTKSAGTVYESHFQWLIRTFWIGGGVYLPALTVLASIAFLAVGDFSKLNDSLRVAAMESGGNPANDTAVVIATAEKSLFIDNAHKLAVILAVFILPFVIWWFWRCWKGLRLLRAGKPVENTMKWF